VSFGGKGGGGRRVLVGFARWSSFVLLGAAGAAATGASEVAAGELALSAELRLNSILGACSPRREASAQRALARASSLGWGP
jgi:hypothetical protein